MNKKPWIAYKQGSNWVINDGTECTQLPYWIITKADLKRYVTDRADARQIKIRVVFA